VYSEDVYTKSLPYTEKFRFMLTIIKETIIYRKTLKYVNYFDNISENKKRQLNKRRGRKYTVNGECSSYMYINHIITYKYRHI